MLSYFMIFVHIGAGAGDLDPWTNFRDGFSEYVKKKKVKKVKFLLLRLIQKI